MPLFGGGSKGGDSGKAAPKGNAAGKAALRGIRAALESAKVAKGGGKNPNGGKK